MKLTGPFAQILTLKNLSLRGALNDDNLEIITNGAILTDTDGRIIAVDNFEELKKVYPGASLDLITGEQVAVPAYVDAHTHICFGGNRAKDFAMRNAGKTYLEIAESGGGIWSTVTHTRACSEEQLRETIVERSKELLQQGITTIEVKSGYGLTVEEELKMLRAIKEAQQYTPATLVPTCLAAHMKPKDFEGSSEAYLETIVNELLPKIKEENLAQRVDIFIEKSAFQPDESRWFLTQAKRLGFEVTVHADQFTPGSSRVAVEVDALSADHLEATCEEDIEYLAKSNTVAIALPGASIGLGDRFSPARKLLDAGAIFAIATDWNPGSAPMGHLMTQASILATFQKLSTAEVFAAITFRAAHALRLDDRGVLDKGKKGDFVTYTTDDFYNILYKQGTLQPTAVYVDGNKVI